MCRGIPGLAALLKRRHRTACRLGPRGAVVAGSLIAPASHAGSRRSAGPAISRPQGSARAPHVGATGKLNRKSGMASRQKFIARNRAPRVQIEYDVEVYGAQKKVQIPFVMGVMSDLSGANLSCRRWTIARHCSRWHQRPSLPPNRKGPDGAGSEQHDVATQRLGRLPAHRQVHLVQSQAMRGGHALSMRRPVSLRASKRCQIASCRWAVVCDRNGAGIVGRQRAYRRSLHASSRRHC